MNRISGWTGSRRTRRFLVAPILASMLVALLVPYGALAVHDIGVFQLDKNASTAVNPAPSAVEDWDLICKANPSTCTFAAGYAVPSGTTVASPNSFVVDPSEASTDDILKGGTKDDNDISSWKWASAKPSPPKNDITHAYAAEYTCQGSEPNSVGGCDVSGIANAGDKLLYFGGDRFSNSGSANLAFWFFQNKITQKLADGTTDVGPGDVCTLGQGCVFGGTHKVGEFPHDPTNVGDILIISAFGPKAQIQVYEWVGVGNAPSPCFTNACSLVPLLPASAGQACEDVTGDNACATVNDLVTASPWTINQKNAPANSFQPTNFFEGGINLTGLGLAGACFTSFLLNTRASAAGDAELHDKVIGQFGRCAPSMTTQASTGGPVTPGTAVTDTATITVTGATSPDDATGTVTFFLCAIATGACTGGGTNVGTGTLANQGGGTTTDGISIATSPSVNDSLKTGSNGPLQPGRYCFRAAAALTNYSNPDDFSNDTTECFTVAKIPTTTTTTPEAPAGTPITSVAVGTSVFDHAIVAGTAAGGNPTGNVNFFICDPAQVTGTAGSEVCADPNGTALTGNPRPLSPVSGSTTNSEATSSPAVVVNKVGVWCFRGVYVPTGNTYLGSSDASHGECFAVTDTTSGTSLQNWLPNDSATVTSTGGIALNGTLDITLREGTCSGTVKYTEPTITLTNTVSGTSFNTANATFKVTAANNATPYYWRIVFTPSASTASYVTGFTKCETTSITINDNP